MQKKHKVYIIIGIVIALVGVASTRAYFVFSVVKSAERDLLRSDYLLVEGNVLSSRDVVSVDQVITNRTDIVRITELLFRSVRANILINNASPDDLYVTELIVSLTSFSAGKETRTVSLIDISRIEINRIAWSPDENGPCSKIHQILLESKKNAQTALP